MEHTSTYRPVAAAISITAAGVIAFTGTVAGPPAGRLWTPPAPRASIETVELAALPLPLQQVWAIATGQDSSYPLPVGSNPVAPITEQLVRTVATYGTQLLTGQFAKIPGEIASQVGRLQSAFTTAATLIVDAMAAVPVVLFSLAFNTALVIGSLPGSASALPTLAQIWLNAALLPVLKIAYNAFAIRNTIAMALQPPQPPQPEPTAATVVSASESTARNVDPRPPRAPTSSGARASKRATAPAAPTLSKRTLSASPARSTAAIRSTPDTKNGDGNHRSHRRAPRTSGSA